MKLFICWSGPRGLQFAQATRAWLTSLFDTAIDVSLSASIEKGAVWFDELHESLREARAGIICVTPESLNSPWIHFEAGMLAKALRESAAAEPTRERRAQLRIFPLLHAVEPGAVTGPLSAYQSTVSTDNDDAWRLAETLLAIVAEQRPATGAPAPAAPPLSEKAAHARFKAAWDSYQAALKQIDSARVTDVVPEFERLFQHKTFIESMYDCLHQGWLERYNRALNTKTMLDRHQDTMRKIARPYAADMFDALLLELDTYAMSMAVLLGMPQMDVEPEGRVRFTSPGIAEACERRRKRIRSLVARLVDERQAPYLDAAFQFEASETFAEKRRVIDRKLTEMRREREIFKAEMDKDANNGIAGQKKKDICRNSDWDLDRIIFYLWQEETWTDWNVCAQLRAARFELDRAIAAGGETDFLAFHFGLKALFKAVETKPPKPEMTAEVQRLITRALGAVQNNGCEIIPELQQTLADLALAIGAGAPLPSPAAGPRTV